MKRAVKISAIALVAAATMAAAPAFAGNVIDDWASIKTPPAPQLKTVTVDPKTTALLMLDFMNQNCGKRPACMASIPAVKKLLTAARAAKVQRRSTASSAIRPRPTSSRMWRRWQTNRTSRPVRTSS